MTASLLQGRLDRIRGGASLRSPNVRVLAAFAGHTGCALASSGFAAGVDFDRLLKGTKYAPQTGQSPFAFARGNSFEAMLRKDEYAPTLKLLQEQMGFEKHDGSIVNLRVGYAPNAAGMLKRVEATRELLREILQNRPAAANLIDGAVLTADIGGVQARFEADAIAARIGGSLHAGEVKSFPVVDGRADADKLSAALDQVAFYIVLVRRVIGELGGDPARASSEAMLITPRNVGLSPTLSRQDVSRRIDRAGRLLARIPKVEDIVAAMPAQASFAVAADEKLGEAQRTDSLNNLANTLGTEYRPDCIGSCGNALFCRERTFKGGSPVLLGASAVRLLPNVESLPRADALACGAKPSQAEKPVALQLARAKRLYQSARSA
jgi:hypothetical protein